LRFLELQTAGDCGSFSAEKSTDRSPDSAGIPFGENDGRRHHEIGGHHLAAAHVRALTRLAAVGERALLHHVAHADAALDDEEAV
jgi:hypothetical protein